MNTSAPAPRDGARYHMARGYAFLAFGMTGAALADFAQANALAPDFLEAYQVRAQLHRARREYAAAADNLGMLLKATPQNPMLYAERATAYQNSGQYDKAIADFSTAIAIAEPYEPIGDFYLARAKAYEMSRRYKDAGADLDRAAARNMGNASVLEAKGRIAYLEGDFEAAQQAFTAALAGTDHTLYSYLWLFLTQKRLGQDARAALAQATEHLALAQWPGALIEAFRGDISETQAVPRRPLIERNALLAEAKLCELSFFFGEARLIDGDGAGATRYFEAARKAGAHEYAEYEAAGLRLDTGR